MEGSIQVTTTQRKALLTLYRSEQTGSRKAQILLLLNEGWSYRQVREVTFASFDLIKECIDRFKREGIRFLINPRQSTTPLPSWLQRVAHWLKQKSPEDFGYFRTRWSCETLAEVLAWETGLRRSVETVRRGLHRLGFVWRRPRPVVGPVDPEHAQKVAEIRHLLHNLSPNETAVFQDEVDINLNPKIGSCWMNKGQQAEVVTPGNNVKRHLAGSLVWRTGRLLVSSPTTRRNAELFVAHLDDLRRRLRGFGVIHVICDNASFHDCKRVRAYLRDWGHRIRVHHLPKYAPETNPIERIWWRLHETKTRNHRCQTIDELLESIFTWIDTQRYFCSKALGEYGMAA
jgi:putative transposase